MLSKSAKTQGIITMKHPTRAPWSPSPNTSPTPYSIAQGLDYIGQLITVPSSDVINGKNISQSSFTPLDVIIDEHDEPINCADEIIIHYAQEDMRKEKQCSYGTACSKKEFPFKCAMNHDGLGDIIKVGTILSENVLCPYERPGFKRCYNGHCTKIHLEGRVEFIEKKKKAYYENKQQSTNSSDNNEDTASVGKDEVELKLSEKTMQSIKATMQNLKNQQLNNSSDNNEDNSSASSITTHKAEPTSVTKTLIVNGQKQEFSPETAEAIEAAIKEFGHHAGDSIEEDWVPVSHDTRSKQQAKENKQARVKAALAAQSEQSIQPTIEA
jgi:hypothetical protein